MTPVTRPLALSAIFRTYASARISQFPVFSAAGIIVASVLDLARISQPKDSQKPQCVHAPRPRYGWERNAIGEGKGCSPNCFAARSNSAPEDFTGMGGSG